MCMCCLSLSFLMCTYMCMLACMHRDLRRPSSVCVTLHLIFLRWDLSLNLELGWQSANPSTPPASSPHSVGFTGAMGSHAQLLHRFWAFEFRSSSYKASILTFLSTKQSPRHYKLRNHIYIYIYTKYLIFNISSPSLCCDNSMIA